MLSLYFQHRSLVCLFFVLSITSASKENKSGLNSEHKECFMDKLRVCGMMYKTYISLLYLVLRTHSGIIVGILIKPRYD